MHSRIFAVFTIFTLLLGLAGPASAAPAAQAPATPWNPFFASPSVAADFGAATRPFGVAVGDFDGDGLADLVIGRTTGNIAFVKGNGDGTFAAPVTFAWKQAFFNAWAFTATDVNGDGKLDVVWGASASSPSTAPFSVNDGEVRAFLGNGNGTFVENPYYVSGVLHNAGVLLADIGIDAGSVAAADVDGDGDTDVVAGAVDGAYSVVRLLRNNGGAFAFEDIISQPTGTSGDAASPTYFPAISTQNSPWGLAFGDADADGDADLWVGDRALYLYLFRNDGMGVFTLVPGYAFGNRPNVYVQHDTNRAAVGYTPSLGADDINGDGRADVVLGLQSGAQASPVVHDGELLLDLATPTGMTKFGVLADIGMVARGVTIADVNGDGYRDIVAAEYGGKVVALRQLPPLDSDGDGISDYVDNAPYIANAPRLDMNTDAAINQLDQLDNDFDTVLGNPEDPSTWVRLGDPADPDDDNDGVTDEVDNCVFTANPDQANMDGDMFGDACDPLDSRDADGDGVPTGPMPGEPGYQEMLAAKVRWSTGDTHFVIRIDALGRFFQNEFTQIMTDAGILSEADWALKCWENYQPDDITGYEPCGSGEGTPGQTLTLPGGKQTPITLITIPKQLWTDAPVVDWINDRNNYPEFELGQHATYHANNTTLGDWASDPTKNYFSCETCGLTEAENYELLKVGYDTLLGNYGNPWVAQSGATAASPKIDWSDAANPLISYAPPFNASDTLSRKATAQFGFKSFSASRFEEETDRLGWAFSPEGSHMEQFDQFGMFHASADLQVDPPDTPGDVYDSAAYRAYLNSITQQGGLNTWLIEEVDWSGRPCNHLDRLGTCNGGSNRENNTVYLPRWQAWLDLLDFAKIYPGGVVMTQGQVALAMGFDNAPTVANPDQADSDADGIGDAIDGATLTAAAATVIRNQPGSLAATLLNGTGQPIANQTVVFTFDADGDGTAETYTGTTDAAGLASATVTATLPVGGATFTVAWDGLRGVTAEATGAVTVTDTTQLTLADAVTPDGRPPLAVATLTDSDGAPLAGYTLTFWVYEKVRNEWVYTVLGTAVTDSNGQATIEIPTKHISEKERPIRVTYGGDDTYSASQADAVAYRLPEP